MVKITGKKYGLLYTFSVCVFSYHTKQKRIIQAVLQENLVKDG